MKDDLIDAGMAAGFGADGPQDAGLEESLPKQIGPYRILEIIGEGGMGTVYLAEQRAPIRRLVALKVIKLGMDSKSLVARFEIERQSLARMEHPCIARVYEAGLTDRGQPYYAMEYVRGVPITEFCDSKQLSIDRIVPGMQGGKYEPENMITACNACNSITSRMEFDASDSREEIIEQKKTHVADRRDEFRQFWEANVRP